MKLAEVLGSPDRVLLGDGANGTCLAARGFHRQPYDLANLQAPDLVVQVHLDYLKAGSDFIETNTYSANRFKLESKQIPAEEATVFELNKAGAELANKAVAALQDGSTRYVLGAMGPVGKHLEPIGPITKSEAFEAFQEQAKGLVAGGVDGFILETFSELGELAVAIEAVRSVSDLPILASKAYIEDGEMLAEGLPIRVSEELASLGVAAVGANCIVGPQRMLDLVRMIAEGTSLPVLAFPTPGLPQLVKGEICYDTSPEYFAKASARLIEEGARIVGGCCGTLPEHIAELRKLVDAGVKPKKRSGAKAAEKTEKVLAQTEPSELAQKIGRKFVVAVEMDVPRGLNIEKLLAGAKQLKIAGADVINISDGARARLRMNPAAVSTLIQTRTGIEVTMHFSCRDRNMLAIQSDLLGQHALGIRNILAVTGDPANIGDYPSATSVFDIDAIGLCRILGRFNEGIDLAGYSVGVKCGFTVCCAYNPDALDQELEDDRLKRKIDAGARVVYTQPVFDEAVAHRAVEACAKLDVPVLVGVLPLKSSRHAEFMHNEVPGVSVPDHLREKMANAADEASALEIGIDEGQKLSAEIRKIAQGLYLMPPFGSAAIAERVMDAVRG